MEQRTISIEVIGPLIKEQIDQGKDVIIKVSGHSMMPFYRHQETSVCLEKITKALKRFDVVFYQNFNGQYLLHRIIAIKNQSFIICGDALTKKEYLDKEQLIAKVKYHERKEKITCENSCWYRGFVKMWWFLRPLRFVLIRFFLSKKNKGAK
ncbi:MAG TPA: S24/S26 family peptidase [Bacilli bacterium]|nr:MAG: hypothetical protein BWY97_01127 [Tenericutes bacterium ADurb.BinA124]HNZ50736.1 S24/S26 family peptidase [Bacilli bacterium]HOH18092.1 S24/S26 family peptidase [Bacilli bacterium]HPX84492.1 S24/S26 family peptidase [Bacilli bacterium]HQC74618.1 S24/S26 family peptidase [Bacilli bacterium]